MKIGVLLSGCGVYDGSEIQEAVGTLFVLDRLGAQAVCLAPDRPQHHAVDHRTGQEEPATRNQLQEAARIARGQVKSLSAANAADLDALVIPGGFGNAKNLTDWAFQGPAGTIDPQVKALILELVAAGKPIAALCVSPVVLAKALEGSGKGPRLSLGTTAAPSPYDIAGFHAAIASLGAVPVECALGEILVDEDLRLVCAPCYMMEATPSQILANIEIACTRLVEMIRA